MHTYVIDGHRITCEPGELYTMLEKLEKRNSIRAMAAKSPAEAKKFENVAASFRRSLEAFKAADRVFNKREVRT